MNWTKTKLILLYTCFIACLMIPYIPAAYTTYYLAGLATYFAACTAYAFKEPLRDLFQYLKQFVNKQLRPANPDKSGIKINCDPKRLFGADVEEKDIQAHLENLLSLFKEDTLILWEDKDHHLHATFVIDGFFKHVLVENFSVDATSDQIQYRGKSLKSMDPLIDALRKAGHHIPDKIAYPNQSKVLKLKSKLLVSAKLKEGMAALPDDLTQLLQNCKAHLECPLCFEKYTEENPAYTVKQTGNSYHKPCLFNHFKAHAYGNPTDPSNRAVIHDGYDGGGYGYDLFFADAAVPEGSDEASERKYGKILVRNHPLQNALNDFNQMRKYLKNLRKQITEDKPDASRPRPA